MKSHYLVSVFIVTTITTMCATADYETLVDCSTFTEIGHNKITGVSGGCGSIKSKRDCLTSYDRASTTYKGKHINTVCKWKGRSCKRRHSARCR